MNVSALLKESTLFYISNHLNKSTYALRALDAAEEAKVNEVVTLGRPALLETGDCMRKAAYAARRA